MLNKKHLYLGKLSSLDPILCIYILVLSTVPFHPLVIWDSSTVLSNLRSACELQGAHENIINLNKICSNNYQPAEKCSSAEHIHALSTRLIITNTLTHIDKHTHTHSIRQTHTYKLTHTSTHTHSSAEHILALLT